MPSKEPLLPAQQPSVWQVTRLVKRQDNSLFNCVNSIVDDAAFVREIALYYPSLPLLANLRCGLWYTPQHDGTCYYKSTDGHHGAWNFSTTRLNWHVAELAANKGGAIIVDATRKGKRFPDAMSKTIPIWAAVINRAVARVRAHDARKRQRRRTYSMDASGCDHGDLLVPVDDTQTSVSAKQPCQPSSPKKARAGDCSTLLAHQQEANRQHNEQQEQQQEEQPLPPQQQEKQQSLQQDAALQQGRQRPDLLLTTPQLQQTMPHVAPEQAAAGATQPCDHPHHRPPQLLQPSSPQGPATPERLQRATSDSPPASPRLVLHRRSQSMLLSPQPSLQEWLEQEEGGLSPVFASRALQRRSARAGTPLTSCPEAFVFGLGPSPSSAPHAAAGSMDAAAAAPVSSGGPGMHEAAACGGSGDRERAAAEASSDAGVGVGQGSDDEHGGACGPSTPRIGSYGNSSSGCGTELPGFDSDLHHPFALAQQQRQQEPEDDCVCSAWVQQAAAAAAAAASPAPLQSPNSFAFPTPDVIAECTAACSTGDASTDDAADGSYSDCGTATASPPLDMPIVVLNGRSHKAEVAASILGIWRAVELEDLSELKHDMADFSPGVRQQASSPTSPGRRKQRQLQAKYEQQQQQHAGSSKLQEWGCNGSGCDEAVTGCRLTRLSDDDDEEDAALPSGLAPVDEAFDRSAAAAGTSQGRQDAQLPPGGLSAMMRQHEHQRQDANNQQQQLPAEQPARAQQRSQHSHELEQQAGCSSDGPSQPWDTQLHLPLWISAAEHAQIEARLDGWVERLFEVGADVRSLAAVLTKPLRPLWVSQASTIWVNQVAQPEELPFTPLVLVSASQPQSYQRQACRQEGDQQQEQWSYVYVSGAGDDEESWSRGLTPSLFWQHQQQLIAAGPHGIAGVVAQLRVAEQLRSSSGHPTAKGRRSRSTSPSAARSNGRSARGAHNLKPKGCEDALTAAMDRAGNGAFWLGSTGIAVGGLQASAAPGMWRHFNAVLCCGRTLHPSLQQEWGAMQLAAKLAPVTCAATARWVQTGNSSTMQHNMDAARGPAVDLDWASSSSPSGHCMGYGRLAWLPVQSSKHQRSSLKDSLGRALAFLSWHLAQGRKVLICDDEGQDACICMAVALLLACYDWPEAGMQSQQVTTFAQPWHVGGPDSHVVVRSGRPVGGPISNGDQHAHVDACHAHGRVAVTKDNVRQRLAFVSSACPSSRPTRGMLKQVFNYFEERRRLHSSINEVASAENTK